MFTLLTAPSRSSATPSNPPFPPTRAASRAPGLRAWAPMAALLTAGLVPPDLAAQEAGGAAVRIRDGSTTMTVEGTSTLRSWSCGTGVVRIALRPEQAELVEATLKGDVVAGTMTVAVPVASLDCRNGTMNEHMRKALRLDQPQADTIVFVMRRHRFTSPGEAAAPASGPKEETPTGRTGGSGRAERTVEMEGTLRLAGQTHPLRIPLTLSAVGEHAMRVRGAAAIPMPTWGMKPPSLMMGTIKVGPVVTVKFETIVEDHSGH